MTFRFSTRYCQVTANNFHIQAWVTSNLVSPGFLAKIWEWWGIFLGWVQIFLLYNMTFVARRKEHFLVFCLIFLVFVFSLFLELTSNNLLTRTHSWISLPLAPRPQHFFSKSTRVEFPVSDPAQQRKWCLGFHMYRAYKYCVLKILNLDCQIYFCCILRTHTRTHPRIHAQILSRTHACLHPHTRKEGYTSMCVFV